MDVDKARQVLAEIDAEVPDSDDVYRTDVLRQRVDRRVRLMYRAAECLEEALKGVTMRTMSVGEYALLEEYEDQQRIGAKRERDRIVAIVQAMLDAEQENMKRYPGGYANVDPTLRKVLKAIG